MQWQNSDKRGVSRHHGSDSADMPATSCICENSVRFLFKQNLGYIGGKIWRRHRTVIAPRARPLSAAFARCASRAACAAITATRMRPARSARCGRCARPRWARRAPSASVRGSPGALAPRQPAECERAGHEDADIRPRRLVPGRLGWRCGERLRSVRGRGSNGCGFKTGPADWLPGSATPPYARRAAHAARQCRGGPPSAVGVARVATPAAKCGLASARAVQRPNQQGGGAAPAPRRLAGQRAGAGAPQRAHISSRSAGRGGEVQWRL